MLLVLSRPSPLVDTYADAYGQTYGETPATAFATIQTDSAGLTDSATPITAFALVVTDSTGLIDSTARVTNFILTQTDSVGLVDTTVRAAGFVLTQTDSAGLVDTQSTAEVIAYSAGYALLTSGTQTTGTGVAPAPGGYDYVGLTDTAVTGVKPAAPTNLAATPVGATTLSLGWTASTNATSYNLYRALNQLSAADTEFVSGVGSWVVAANANIGWSSGAGTSSGVTNPGVMQFTSTTTNPATEVTVQTNATSMSVSPGQRVVLSAWLYVTASNLTVSLQLNWWAAGDVFLSVDTDTARALTPNQWNKVTFSAVAPATTVRWMAVIKTFGHTAAGSSVFVDDVVGAALATTPTTTGLTGTSYADTVTNGAFYAYALSSTGTGGEGPLSTPVTGQSGRTVTQAVTDSAGLTDGFSTNFVSGGSNFTQPANDNAGLTDSATPITAFALVVTDSTGLIDSTARVTNFILTQTDSVGLVDTTVRAAGFVLTQTDNAGLTDTAAPTYGPSFTDSAGLVDTTVRNTAYGQGVNDPAGLSDLATTSAAMALAQTDTTGLVDNSTRAAGFSQTSTDSAGLSDSASPAASFALTLTDSAGLVDTTTRTFTDRLIPDAILANTGVTGPVTSVQDDPSSPDANELTTTGAWSIRFSFEAPGYRLKTGAGAQTFRVVGH